MAKLQGRWGRVEVFSIVLFSYVLYLPVIDQNRSRICQVRLKKNIKNDFCLKSTGDGPFTRLKTVKDIITHCVLGPHVTVGKGLTLKRVSNGSNGVFFPRSTRDRATRKKGPNCTHFGHGIVSLNTRFRFGF